MNSWAIEVEALSKQFGGQPALREVSLRVAPGEMVALLGASGSGKSTLMRHLNGLHRADAGSASAVRLFGRELQRGGRLVPGVRAMRAEVATIFQQFNLVPRLPVMHNVMAGALSACRCGAPSRGSFQPPSSSAPGRRCSAWASATARGSGHPRCRAGSSSARPSRAPWCRAPA